MFCDEANEGSFQANAAEKFESLVAEGQGRSFALNLE
jgi:hypothetical protein